MFVAPFWLAVREAQQALENRFVPIAEERRRTPLAGEGTTQTVRAKRKSAASERMRRGESCEKERDA